MPSPYLRTVTNAFDTACRIPSLKAARMDPLGGAAAKDGGSSKMVTATWSQASIAAGRKMTFATTFVLEKKGGALHALAPGLPTPLAENDLQATEGPVTVQIQKFKGDKGNDQEVLHIFRAGRLDGSFNLTDMDLHGPVYFDDELGGIAINQTTTKIAYIAEAKVPKSTPFYKKTNGDKTDQAAETEVFGQEFRFREEFGEQMVSKSKPVIVVVDMEVSTSAAKFEVLADPIPPNWCPGQLSFWKDFLIGTAVHVAPRNLGLVYCSNRPSAIFSLCLEKKVFKMLTADKGLHARSPRVSPKGTLVWLERGLHLWGWYPGPHQASFRLMAMELPDDESKRTILDGGNPAQIHYVGKEMKDYLFHGIFQVSLPKRCFTSDDKYVVFSNIMDDTYFPTVVNVETGDCHVQRQSSNSYVLDVFHEDVLACHSVPLHAPTVSFGSVVTKDDHKPVLNLQLLEKSAALLPGFVHETLRFKPINVHPDPKFKDVVFSGIYVGPATGIERSVPLIVWPHGGPHSVSPTSFITEAYFFALLGYAVMFVNYRGSTGAGEMSVKSILGNIGETDVEDCDQARAECLSKYPHLNYASVVLFGGSHGGFLVTHLVGQYPDAYCAVVARNPVINLATMATVTDIPDWTNVEAGFKYEGRSPEPELMKAMLAKSPIAHVQHVTAPVYLMIGKLDLRVPPSQGLEYYYSLKALGKKVEMNVYEDNHPLAKVPVNINVMINSALFFHSVINHR